MSWSISFLVLEYIKIFKIFKFLDLIKIIQKQWFFTLYFVVTINSFEIMEFNNPWQQNTILPFSSKHNPVFISISTNSLPLVLLPITFIIATIRPFVNSKSISFIIDPITFVRSSIWPNMYTWPIQGITIT